MSEKDFPLQNICIFGYGMYGKMIYDSIKRINTDADCIFCDNDSRKYIESVFEVVAPITAVNRVRTLQLDAIVIPGLYPSDWQIEMVIQLAGLGEISDAVYFACQDSISSDMYACADFLLKKLSDVNIADLPGYGPEFGVNKMDMLFKLARSIQTTICRLTDEYDIDGVKRILVYNPMVTEYPNNGDVWYFLSRVPVYERVNSCKLVLLIDRDNAEIIYRRSRFLEYDDYSFEFVTVDTSEISTNNIFDGIKANNKGKHFDIFVRFFAYFESERFRTFQFRATYFFADFFSNTIKSKECEVWRPSFPHFNKQYYVDIYGVDPGKTFWIIPDSNFAKPFPISYWNLVAAMLRNIGYTVVFNSKNPDCNGTLAFIPWDDVVGFAELCGHVIGTRSGFFDFAIIAKANFYIFTPPPYSDVRVEDVFNVDNSDGHVRTIPIRRVRNYTNLPEFNCFDKIGKNFVEYIFDLSCDKDKYVIFIASKCAHCPPSALDKNKKLGALSLLGLIFDFSASFGWSYCAVIDGGNVIAEKSSPDKSVMFTYTFEDGNHVGEIISEGFNVNKEHCRASIVIDGIQTCMNIRGLNFVIWDKSKGEAAEIVVFDTYDISSIYNADSLDWLVLNS